MIGIEMMLNGVIHLPRGFSSLNINRQTERFCFFSDIGNEGLVMIFVFSRFNTCGGMYTKQYGRNKYIHCRDAEQEALG